MMLDATLENTRIRYFAPEELTDIHEGLFPNSSIRTFGLTSGLLLCTDNFTGRTHKTACYCDQAAAIFWLILAGQDDPESPIERAMYEVADRALIDCPPECRPIP